MELWSKRTQKNRPLVIIRLCQVLLQQHKAMSLHFCSLPPPAFDLQLVLMGSILGNTCTTPSTSNHAGCITKDECREGEEQGKSAKDCQVVGTWLLTSPQNMTRTTFCFFYFSDCLFLCITSMSHPLPVPACYFVLYNSKVSSRNKKKHKRQEVMKGESMHTDCPPITVLQYLQNTSVSRNQTIVWAR